MQRPVYTDTGRTAEDTALTSGPLPWVAYIDLRLQQPLLDLMKKHGAALLWETQDLHLPASLSG